IYEGIVPDTGYVAQGYLQGGAPGRGGVNGYGQGIRRSVDAPLSVDIGRPVIEGFLIVVRIEDHKAVVPGIDVQPQLPIGKTGMPYGPIQGGRGPLHHIGKSHLLKMEGLVEEPDPGEGCKIVVHIEVGNSDPPLVEGEQPMDVRVFDPPGDSCAPAELAPDVGEHIPGQGAEGPEGKIREI